MRLVFALLAESAIVNEEDGRVSMLGAGFDLIEADAFPHRQDQLALTFQVELDRKEADTTHMVSVKTLDPRGQLLVKEAATRIGVPLIRHPDMPIGITLVLSMHGARFPQSGDYRFVISVDSEELGSVVLRLLLKSTASSQPLAVKPPPQPLRLRRGRH
jgi:hypothetical protein